MSLQKALFFVGIDWATAEHAVCVLDRDGRKVTAFAIEHTAAGFAQLAVKLGRLGEAARVPVAIERPSAPRQQPERRVARRRPQPCHRRADRRRERSSAQSCTFPPASQDLDGHVSKLPEGFGDGQHTVNASGSAPPYFLDLYFYDAECKLIGSFASFAPDEISWIPSGTAYWSQPTHTAPR